MKKLFISIYLILVSNVAFAGSCPMLWGKVDSSINNVADMELKERIQELFKIKYVYTLREILSEIKNTYKGEQKELFEDWFVYQALDKLVPVEKNEFITATVSPPPATE